MRLLLIIVLFVPFLIQSQIATTVQGAGTLVQNVLLGPGVTVSNINYSGAAQAIGSFSGSAINFGLTNGIVITTGTVNAGGNGPQGPNNSSNAGINNNTPGFNLLSNQIGGSASTYNAAILEFDFVPYADTVRFRYVFGSEEYPEYVGSDFNDVFAFFISGPGISGLQNIARLPNGSPVAINNVNNGPSNAGPCANCANYVYNGDGNTSPYNGSNQYLQYDGFTRVLEAVSKVQCGQTYHLIIAIADVGDGIYDSGIFLEANSLTSNVPVQVTHTLSNDAFGDGVTMAEGCVSATVNLSRSGNLSNALTVPITVSGTATELTDYTDVPSSVTFAPGQSSVSFSFDALFDGLNEGVETVNLSFAISDPCGNVNSIPLNLKINDVQPVSVTATANEVQCPGDPVVVEAIATGGGGGYTYQWSNGNTNASFNISPTSTQTFTVTVTDDCLNESASAMVTVNVPVFTPLTVTHSADIVEICPYVPATLTAEGQGGAGTYFYSWVDNNGNNLGDAATIDVVPSTSTSYTVTVTDLCGNTVQGTVNYTITSPPLVLTMTPDRLICPYDPVSIGVTATGGYGAYFYDWQHSDETTPTVTVAPGSTTVYTVSVSDECQTFEVLGSTTVTVIRPVADFEISSSVLFNDLPITFHNLTTGGVSYYWTFGDGNTSTMVHPNNTYDDPGTYEITLIATNQLGCKDSITKPITIAEEYWVYIPNTFTPDGNIFNNTFDISTVNVVSIEVQIFNRWGQLIFQTKDLRESWDGTYKDQLVQDGTYTYKVKYLTKSGIEEVLTGHVNVLR